MSEPSPKSISANIAKTVVRALGILASILFLYGWFIGFGPPFDLSGHTTLGEVAAAEALKLAGPTGRIVLITRDTRADENPAADAQVAGFKLAIKRSSARLGSIRLIKQNPLRLVTLPPAIFLEALRKERDADVIVSFLGPPVLDDVRAASLHDKRPKIVALCSGRMPRQIDLRRIFQQELLSVAILSREPSLPTPPSSSARQRFDALFTVVTPTNVSDLPLVASSNP